MRESPIQLSYYVRQTSTCVTTLRTALSTLLYFSDVSAFNQKPHRAPGNEWNAIRPTLCNDFSETIIKVQSAEMINDKSLRVDISPIVMPVFI